MRNVHEFLNNNKKRRQKKNEKLQCKIGNFKKMNSSLETKKKLMKNAKIFPVMVLVRELAYIQ